MSAHQTLEEIGPLRSSFSGRDAHFSEAFKLIAQNDELAQDNMESFVTNDPRTLWNMATFLLEPKPLTHTISRVDGGAFDSEQAIAATMLEALLTRTWVRRSRRNMRRGGSSWFAEFLGNMTATGWYAVPHFLAPDRFFVDYWMPNEVFPEFSDDEEEGLLRLARIFTLSWPRAMQLIRKEGWDINAVRSLQSGPVTVVQYWKLVDGKPWLSVVVGQDEVRSGPIAFDRIPILTGGIGGIPANAGDSIKVKTSDPQSIVNRADATALRGQSIISTNEQVYKSINRQSSFIQQILHDIANPKTFEKVSGGRVVVENPEDLFKRGAHFRLGVDDELGTLASSGIPPEGSQLLFNLRNMAQRGGFSDITFGNFVQEVTLGLISQAAESAQQILFPYYMATKYVFTTVSQTWLDGLLESPETYKNLITATEIEALKVLNKVGIEIEVIADYAIKIPGDLANRVNLARTTSSKFDLAPEDSIRLFLPEISDVGAALARLETAKAKEHPAFQQTLLISSLKQAATQLKDVDPERSRLLIAVARRLEQELLGQGQPPPEAGRGQSELSSQQQAGLSNIQATVGSRNGNA